MTKLIKSAALAIAIAIPGLLAAAVPASASSLFDRSPAAGASAGVESAWQHGRDRRHGDDYGDRGYSGGRGHYGDRGSYGEPVNARTRVWRGNDGRYYCRKGDGTTGLLIGAAVGGLIGHEVAGRGGDRTLGAILGVAGGALLGRAIDRSDSRCR